MEIDEIVLVSTTESPHSRRALEDDEAADFTDDFIYLVMVAQFESFKHPFVVIFTLPLSIIGVMFSLILTNNPLSVIAVVGIILLLGIVVNNSILLVDYINQQKEKGHCSSFRSSTATSTVKPAR